LLIQEAADSVKQQQIAFPSAGRLWFISLAVCLVALIGVGAAHFFVPEGTWSSLLTTGAGAALILFALYLLFGLNRALAVRRHYGTLLTDAADSVFRHSPFSMAVLDEKGRFREVNDGTVHLLGYEKSELLGQLFLPVIETDNRIETAERFEAALQGDVQQISLMMKHKSGIPLDVQMTLTPYAAADGGRGVVLFSQDMSDRKRSSERIRYMAYYDDMTGLPNRRLYMMHVTEALSRPRTANRRVAVLYLDLDRFKLVNDSFGRDFGDMLLLQVAERLTRDLEEHDVAARMEGDEFAILYESVASDEEALERARKLLALLEEPFELQGHPFHMSASIGIATNGDGATDPNVVVKKADIALGTVKDNGRNDCLLYTGELDNSSLEKLTMQHEMRKALAQGEFVLYYQPQYQIETGEVVGLEALVRWQHPERGMIPPGKFISIAEESGLIVQLGDWVLAEACRQNKEWQDQGLPPVPVSVNLSIRQFLQQNLTDKVASVLEETGLAPRYLDLEITESMTMDVQYASAQLIELSKLGVGISVDDFGTGYSSFHYLKNFPINRLKIDRSFVRDIQQDPNDAAIVAAIIAMAHNMNLHVIAEGVETEEQLFFLKKHRCDEMQGYYRSPPVPSPQVAGLLRTS
jgi:diguanylate cyclase (GGDEF)-like protein/PAS domain S-box-containing protein